MQKIKAILFAILAAVLYSLMTPVAKLMQVSVSPVAEAGLLYLGAGIGMSVIYIAQQKKGRERSRPVIGKEDLKYVLAMIMLDMLAPIFLLIGLSTSTPESVSLLNNFEIVATTVIAVCLFHEPAGKKLVISICLITLSCVLLSFDSTAPLRFSAGSLFVLLACICWGFENNCTSSLSEKDTRQIVIIKGLGSGMASLLLSFVVGEEICGIFSCCVVMILGFLAIGLSVYYYVLAQSEIGKLFWIALAIMAVGVYINVKDIQEVL